MLVKMAYCHKQGPIISWLQISRNSHKHQQAKRLSILMQPPANTRCLILAKRPYAWQKKGTFIPYSYVKKFESKPSQDMTSLITWTQIYVTRLQLMPISLPHNKNNPDYTFAIFPSLACVPRHQGFPGRPQRLLENTIMSSKSL